MEETVETTEEVEQEIAEEEKVEEEEVEEAEEVIEEEEVPEEKVKEAAEAAEEKKIIAVEKEEKKKELEEEIVEEKFYTIPLGKAWIYPRKKRAPKAMRIVKSFIKKHMKLRTEVEVEGEEEAETLVISNEVNEKIWSRGIEKPPRKIRVRAVKDKEGVVTVHLVEGD